MSRLNQQIPSQNKNSLERKFQKTMENLKTSDRLLPRSYLDKNSNLIPNHLATKTFKQGRTLHSVLCGEETSQKVLSSTSGKKDRIPFYRDVNRSMNSTISSISSSGTQMTSQTGPRRRIEFSKAIGSPTSNPRFDENGYAIPSTTNSPPKIKITKDIGSPQVFCEGHTTLLIDDENFESAFEESFDTEERERREKINKKNNNSEDKSMDHLDKLNNTNINGDAGSPINLPNIQNEGHIFMADLDKHVREIKEGLNFVSEKLDSVVDHMDKTLGEDPNISDDNLMANNKFGYLYTSFKSTQTPVSWLNKGDNVVEKQNKVQHKASQDEKRKRDLMLDRKYLLRHRIDTLKEFTRIQLYLIREEQRNAVDDKDCFSNKFKQLMSDFDAEKKKIKMELLNCFDKSTLINHYIQMFKQQEETRKLIACFKAKQELKLMECHHYKYYPNTRISSNTIENEQHQSIQEVNLPDENIVEPSEHAESSDDDLDSTLDVFDAVHSSKNFDNSDASTPKKLTPNVPLLDFTLLSINEDIKRKNPNQQQIIDVLDTSAAINQTSSLNANIAQCPLEFLADMAITSKESELNKNTTKKDNSLPYQMDFIELEHSSQQDQQEGEQNSDSLISSQSVDEDSTNDNTSEDITSLPFVSENVGNVAKLSNNDEDQELKQSHSAIIQSPRIKNFENIVIAQEQLIEQISNGFVNSEVVNNISILSEAIVKVVEVNEDNEVENEPLPFNSSRSDSDSILEEIPSPRATVQNNELIRETEFVKNKSENLNSSERERTSAEIESIPEEIISIRNRENVSSLSSSSTPSKAEQNQPRELSNDLDSHVTSRNINQINESLNSTLEDVSEGLISSFKPSEKSLRSILSSLPNSSTGRDSLSRRRSSASEALLKLRIMNNVPTISTKSPPCQKSPPRTTPRSPTERYLTKFPQNISSRESISNDEALILRQSLGPVELLEDLPNASQLGMVLDLSHSPSVSLPDVNILIKKEDEYSEEKKFIENYVKLHWNEFIENGEIVNDLFSIEEILKNNLNDQLKIPNNLLQQLCYEHWFNLIWNSNCLLSSKHILLSKENLIGYLQKEILSPFIDKLKKEICPNGIKTRAEKTSHLALDVNRLLLAQYVYENLTI